MENQQKYLTFLEERYPETAGNLTKSQKDKILADLVQEVQFCRISGEDFLGLKEVLYLLPVQVHKLTTPYRAVTGAREEGQNGKVQTGGK